MSRLGVNIDHIATIRNARGTLYPDPLDSVPILVNCGVDQITCHLREDRRHIRDDDLKRLIQSGSIPVNLEMAATEEMVVLALRERPHTCTLVPEKREELTTEGGLNLGANLSHLRSVVSRLHEGGIRVSLFIDPEAGVIDLACQLGVKALELHTGAYCEVFGGTREKSELKRLELAAEYAAGKGLAVFAGHGLNWINLRSVTRIIQIEEYNIGHSIIARALFLGLEGAVREILELISKP